ncbi:MAG: GTP cyclohydrolase II, partial [Pseudomonadota bacterium]
AANLLRALKVASVRMITGNPEKIADLKSNRIDVTSALDLWANNASARALEEIREKMARGYIYER